MKRFAVLGFLGLLATGPAAAQDLSLSGSWDATNARCNCGNMSQRPSIWGSGYNLTVTNSCGQSGTTQWTSAGRFVVPEWGTSATVRDQTTIVWGNGCVWRRQWQQ